MYKRKKGREKSRCVCEENGEKVTNDQKRKTPNTNKSTNQKQNKKEERMRENIFAKQNKTKNK